MNVKKEFEKLVAGHPEGYDGFQASPGYSTKFGYYGKFELIRDRAKWELSCALITRDWSRVRNALLILGANKDGETEAE